MQLTGRDLIIYIMQNNLEDKVVIDTMGEGEAAVKFGVGVNSIRVWYKLGLLKGFDVNGHLVIWRDSPDPRKVDKHE